MTSGDVGGGANGPSRPWHQRTPAVVGASVLALAAIGIVILSITYLTRQFSEPEQAPLNFVEPTFSATSPRSDTPTTTQTITSTRPPQTTEIGGPLDPATPPSTTSDTSSSTTSSSETTTPPSTTEEDEGSSEEPTTRTTRRPRTNVTRTFNPYG